MARVALIELNDLDSCSHAFVSRLSFGAVRREMDRWEEGEGQAGKGGW